MKFQAHIPDWRSYVPILDVLAHYRRRDLSHDLTAGLIVGVITVPQAIAYAFLAGLPPEAGLYACLVPMILYAILGSSRELVVGPVAIAALMVAATIGQYAPSYGGDYLGITAVLCLQAGIFLWLLRLTQMAGMVNLLSHPVISGFINAAALMIIVSQIPAFLGINVGDARDPFSQLIAIGRNVPDLNRYATAIGIGSLVLLFVIRRFGYFLVLPFLRRVGRNHAITRIGPMVVAIIAVVVVSLLNLDGSYGVTTVGHVPGGLPTLTIPPFNYAMWVDLAPAAAMIALVAFVESFSIGTTLAARKRRRINANQELIALGAANIGAAFTGAYPVAGSFSRSSVNFSAGARTPVSSLICAVVIIVTLLWLTPLFASLPHAALAAIIMASVATLIDFSSPVRAWSFYRHDAITHLITLGGVLLFGVESGLVLGVFVAIAYFVRRSSRPHIALVGRFEDSPHFRNVLRHNVDTLPHVAAVRIDENIYFANANQIENRLLKVIAENTATEHLVLVCSAINFIDSTGLEMLSRVNRNLERMDIRMHLSEVKGPVLDQLKATNFQRELSGNVYFTTDQAFRGLEKLAPPPTG